RTTVEHSPVEVQLDHGVHDRAGGCVVAGDAFPVGARAQAVGDVVSAYLPGDPGFGYSRKASSSDSYRYTMWHRVGLIVPFRGNIGKFWRSGVRLRP
ncbi:hypothetical protein, partial [Micromonospora sp. D75]|uniref:hypothetical protein n=1 Tax=Micromonospora sp. D75 TaxID=2824885 RepID=UPI001B359C1D